MAKLKKRSLDLVIEVDVYLPLHHSLYTLWLLEVDLRTFVVQTSLVVGRLAVRLDVAVVDAQSRSVLLRGTLSVSLDLRLVMAMPLRDCSGSV